MPADLDRFRSDWNTFADLLRGQLIQRSKTGALSLASANLILSGAASFWESTHTAGGRWLAAYEHRFPEKGGLIRDILLSDMKFTREETAGPDLSPLRYVLPIGAAAAGFLISRGLGASRCRQHPLLHNRRQAERLYPMLHAAAGQIPHECGKHSG